MRKHICLSFLFIFLIQIIITQSIAQRSHAYYVSANGSDANDGSLQHPWKTIARINNITYKPGDSINLRGGDTFTGTIHLQKINGNHRRPVILQSYGTTNAVIDAKDSSALILDSCIYMLVNHLTVKGSGRKEGNTKDGVAVLNSNNIYVSHINTSGFQKSGLLILDSKDIEATDIYAYDNGFAGIYISGEYGDKLHCQNIKVFDSHTENNPGDPTNFGNHSGNGILAGFCTNILIDNCTANNNGWDMPRKGNGPVGIWCYEADSVVIQHCLSYQNKTSQGGEDGGGYDLDGGTTNSIIQYCLSYENQGSAFGIFQYDGATPWHDNVIRWCISENDGTTSAAHANAYVWNSSHDSSQLKNLLFYNNTLYNETGNAVAYSSESEHSNLRFYNNIFVTKEDIMIGDYSKDVFISNDWWSQAYRFKIDSATHFTDWLKQSNKEQIGNKSFGRNLKPFFKSEGKTKVMKSSALSSFTGYQLAPSTRERFNGIDIKRMFDIDDGGVDFNGYPVKKNIIGACSR